MIDRYTDPAIEAVFAPEATYARWLRVEQAVIRAQAEAGLVPRKDARLIHAHQPRPDDWPVVVSMIQDVESRTKHDVEAFVQVMGEFYGEAGRRWFHFGLTSSDVVDTGLGMAIRDSAPIVRDRASAVSQRLARIIDRGDIPAVARTHGVPAARITVRNRAQAWLGGLHRAIGFFSNAAGYVSVGQASGPVGTWGKAITPQIEAEAMQSLKLGPMPFTTQIVPRDLHATYLFALARLTGAAAKIATDVRLLTVAGEATVPFEPGQVGSSSMPHKRNPIDCEKIAGLDRLVRGYMNAELESATLWLERDISHSSVERVAIPDALHATCHVLTTLAGVLDRVEFPEPDVESIPDSYERTVEGILSGMSRQEARDAAAR